MIHRNILQVIYDSNLFDISLVKNLKNKSIDVDDKNDFNNTRRSYRDSKTRDSFFSF